MTSGWTLHPLRIGRSHWGADTATTRSVPMPVRSARVPGRAGRGEGEFEAAAFAGAAPHAHGPAVSLGDRLHDREPQPHPAGVPRTARVRPGEPVEDDPGAL